MRTINANELKDLLDRGEDLVLLNVLDPDAFEHEHIPGSINIPNRRLDFIKEVEKVAERKDRRVIVHCSNKLCQQSPDAARKLERAGYTNVIEFQGGMAEWKQAGFGVESGAASPTR
jgi:rhodanese-related sulfurtransferase